MDSIVSLACLCQLHDESASPHIAIYMEFSTACSSAAALEVPDFYGNCLHDVLELRFMIFCLKNDGVIVTGMKLSAKPVLPGKSLPAHDALLPLTRC